MRREERVTVQGPVKEQQPDGMSHGGATLFAMGLPASGDHIYVVSCFLPHFGHFGSHFGLRSPHPEKAGVM